MVKADTIIKNNPHVCTRELVASDVVVAGFGPEAVVGDTVGEADTVGDAMLEFPFETEAAPVAVPAGVAVWCPFRKKSVLKSTPPCKLDQTNRDWYRCK